jgi:hypothetical protein
MRRRVTIGVLAGIATLALAATPAAISKPRTNYCSPSGDYCTAVKGKPGSPRFDIGSFAFRGPYQLCVSAPDGSRACQNFRLKPTKKGFYRSVVQWRGVFPDLGPGRYFVAWSLQGAKLGPRLSFAIG